MSGWLVDDREVEFTGKEADRVDMPIVVVSQMY